MVPDSGLSRTLTVLALLLLFPTTAVSGPFVFGLDNRPQVPISIDPLGFGNGTEDPFGLVPVPMLVGPSPSLQTFSVPLGRTLSDADILLPGVVAPEVNTARPLNTNYVDAISSNLASEDGRALRLAFSVDRASTGVAPSAVSRAIFAPSTSGRHFSVGSRFPGPRTVCRFFPRFWLGRNVVERWAQGEATCCC